MNFLAGLLLTYLPSEADAFGALSLLMHQRCLREMYLPDMSLLQIRLWQLSKLLPPRLAAHLEAHAALPVLYASSWLLTCFAADFPLHFAARVMDVLMTGHAAASPMLKVLCACVCMHVRLSRVWVPSAGQQLTFAECGVLGNLFTRLARFLRLLDAAPPVSP